MTKRYLSLSTAVMALAMFGAGATGVSAADVSANAADKTTTTVQDLIVTASRRDEKLQDVPIALDAFGGKALQQLGITNFEQLLLSLPDVHAAGRGPGQNSVYIRGLSTDTASILIGGAAGTNPNVAIYLDDIAVSMPVRNLDIYAADLDRVEVLKGPQGTTFGASSMGGAVRYITAKPNLTDFHYGFSTSYSENAKGGDSSSANGYVNLPIIKDKFAVRLVAYTDNQGGYIDNVAGTYQMPVTSPGFGGNAWAASISRPVVDNSTLVKKNFNTADYKGFRVAAKYQISENWSVEVQDLTQSLNTEGVFDYDPTLGDLKAKRFNPDNLIDKGNVLEWNVNGRLGQLDLVYTGGYVERRAVQNTDYTAYSNSGGYAVYYNCNYAVYHAVAYKQAPAAGAACFSPKNHVHNDTRNTRFSEELRLSTPSDWRLRGSAGLYYDTDHVYDQDEFAYEGSSAGGGFPGANEPFSTATAINRNITDPSVQFVNDVTRSDRQYAVYGEAAYDIIPKKLTASVGLRYYDQQVGIAGSASYGSRFSQSADHGISLQNYAPVTETGVIPKLNLTYHATDDVMIYGTYSEGFRPGGFNRGGGNVNSKTGFVVPVGYGTDSVKNYELGWKTQWLDRTLTLNGAAYFIQWDKLQSQIYRPADSFLTFVQNAANAEIKGVEADAIWRPAHGLTLSANVAYTHSELTSILPGISNLRPVGSQLALTPEMQGTFVARYEHEFVPEYTSFFQGTATAAGRMLSTIDRGADTTGTPLHNDIELHPYTTGTISTGVMKDNWTLELFVNNVSDARPELYANASDRTLRYTTTPPRTVGVRFSAKY